MTNDDDALEDAVAVIDRDDATNDVLFHTPHRKVVHSLCGTLLRWGYTFEVSKNDLDYVIRIRASYIEQRSDTEFETFIKKQQKKLENR